MKASHTRLLGIGIAVLAFVLDQGSKLFLMEGLGFADKPLGMPIITVTPFFDLMMVHNPGVSFGLFPATGVGGWLFLIGFSVTIVAALGYWLWRNDDWLTATGIGLIIGGALGNVLDRFRFGWVADFFHLHAFGYDWYVFNVADAGIVAGVGLLLYESLLGSGQTGHKATHADGRELSDRGRGQPGQG